MTGVVLRRRLLARWKIITAILVLLGVGSLFSHIVVSQSWHYYLLTQRGENTQGYIIDVWEDYEPAERGGGFWIHGATYTYQLPDGREFTGRLKGEGRLRPEFRSLTQPYPVEVAYLPDNPAVSCISSDLPDNILGILFYNVIHPSWFLVDFSALAMFIAGTLGITIFPAGIAAIIAAFFIIPKQHKHRYLYYFAILFLILSLISVVISASNAWYAGQFLP